jgi:aspartyl aminopeptidase
MINGILNKSGRISMANKSKGQQLFEKLSLKKTNAWLKITDENRSDVFKFCDEYIAFMNSAKTEREYIQETVNLLEQSGFVPLELLTANKLRLAPGMKIYQVNRNKALAAAVIGKEPLMNGANIIGSHVDSPRIDLKPSPVYEEDELVLLKTHYYGGIKKYQWVTIPLALHGVIVKQDGEMVNISIGDSDDDPLFTITDLLPHLAKKQMEKKMDEGITGEGLNLLFGSIPYNDGEVGEKVKLNILNLLNQKYGITEEDFASAELEIIPAFKATDVGLDRSMVGAYAQDDRVCAYASVRALLDVELPEKTAVCLLTDREEVGSMGNTGARSVFFEDFMSVLCSLEKTEYNDNVLRALFRNSTMLSADVNPAVDPNYSDVQDKRNASYFGRGVIIQKYTGVRGKSGGSEASAEFIASLRKVFNENDVPWQTAELGKVDLGGGGTIAQFIADLGVEVVDCGVPLLSMHSPFEITSKIDIYNSYRAYVCYYCFAKAPYASI